MKSGFRRAINWNKYQSNTTTQAIHRYLDHLIDSSFLGVNGLLIFFTFDNNANRERHARYFFPNIKIKDYNFMISGKKFFHQPIKNDMKTYDNIRKIQLVKEVITQLVIY